MKKRGYAVIAAVDGEDALAKAREHKPDLILLDVIMPKLQGFEVLASLKSDAATRDIPVIMLSNLQDESDVRKATDAGALDYLVKSNVRSTCWPRGSPRPSPARARNVQRSLISRRRAFASSALRVLVSFGYDRSRSSSVFTTISATSARAYHFRSAGITYHGACSRLVSASASPYADMNAFHFARSSRSPDLNFQFFSGSSMRSSRRRCCSALDT